MLTDPLKHELQIILSGESQIGKGNLIETTARYLRGSSKASAMVENSKQDKRKEESRLIEYIDNKSLWITNIKFSDFISEGAEQRVYINGDKSVLKLNDSIYYSSWLDYLNNLLLNNFFFPDTLAYQVLPLGGSLTTPRVFNPFFLNFSQSILNATKNHSSKEKPNWRKYNSINESLRVVE